MQSVYRVILMSIVLFSAACSANDRSITDPTDLNVRGTWILRGVNNSSLPYVAAADGVQRWEFLSGRIELRADHTFIDIVTNRFTQIGSNADPVIRVDSASGTWQLVGSNVGLTFTGLGTEGVVISNGLMARAYGGFLFGYRK